jgi:MFS family permease
MCSFAMTVPTIVRFWQSHGLTLSDVTLLEAVWATTMALAQIPTGYLADLLSRRTSIFIGSVLMLLGALIYCVAGDFSSFLLAEIALGMAMAFVGGADQALLYESLKELGREGEFQALWSRSTSIAIGMTALACLVGGLLASEDLRQPFYLVAVSTTILMLVALSLEEPPRQKMARHGTHLKEFVEIARFCFGNRRLAWLILFAGFIQGWMQAALWFYQPYFSLCGIEVIYFGAIFATFNLCAATTSWFANRINERVSEGVRNTAMIVMIATGYLLLSTTTATFGFCLILLHQMVRGFTQAILSSQVIKQAREEIRATVASIYSLSCMLLYVVALLPAGWVADRYGVLGAFRCLGIIGPILGLVLMCIRPRK